MIMELACHMYTSAEKQLNANNNKLKSIYAPNHSMRKNDLNIICHLIWSKEQKLS